jgi:glycerophosphoryl diester phosphodiesterase
MGRGNARFLAAAATGASIAGLLAIALGPSAGAVAPDPNPWLQRHFLNMAHQGGEDEAPSNTLFAFKSAIRDRGADTLELDVNLAKDNPAVPDKDELMVIHNDTVNRTTQETRDRASGFSEVNDLTVGEIQALDAGYTFRPGHYDKTEPASSYPYRGVRTGAIPPPAGYTADDFAIPTLRQVLDAFPSTPINIEIKMIKTTTGAAGGCETQGVTMYCDDPVQSVPVADAVADLLDEPQYASRNDIIVVSFSDALVSEFHSQDDGGNVALAPAIGGIASYLGSGDPPIPDVAAFQVPPKQGGADVPTLLLSSPRHAHADGYAVHVWANGEEPESEASYARLLALGIDGYMSSEPSRLAAYLCAQGIPHPDGSPRCPAKPATPAPRAKKKCKKRRKAAATKTAAGSSAETAKKKRCKKHKKRR